MSLFGTQEVWPSLPYAALRPTLETLHLFTQVVGKVRVARTPWVNHSWQSTLYVSARGLTTSLIPHGALSLEIEFDFIAHALVFRITNGGERRIPLGPGSVADFYAKVMRTMEQLGVEVSIDRTPNEIPDVKPFPEDTAMRVYE